MPSSVKLNPSFLSQYCFIYSIITGKEQTYPKENWLKLKYDPVASVFRIPIREDQKANIGELSESISLLSSLGPTVQK